MLADEKSASVWRPLHYCTERESNSLSTVHVADAFYWSLVPATEKSQLRNQKLKVKSSLYLYLKYLREMEDLLS